MNTKKRILMYCLFLLIQTITQAQTTSETIKSGQWSDPSIWNTGTTPNSSTNVLIKSPNSVVIDTDVQVKSITVKGTLKPSNTKNINISTNYIFVQGSAALMEWGTANAPYSKNTVITLTGTNMDPPIPTQSDLPVHKGIMVMGGAKLNLFGINKTSWTQLGATATKNAKQIVLADQVNWSVGDKIVIASSDYDMNHAETRYISSISTSGNQTIVNFSNPLSYKHFGELQQYTSTDGSRSWELDERAEVGLLSHNIKIQGDEQSTTSKFGGHIMVMMNSKAYLSNVELYRMGQESVLGRYPFHWHLNGNSNGQFISNCSVHESYNRAITVHSTNNVKVSNNVCYDNIGHAYFLESGSETGNVIEYNLGLVTKRPAANKAILPSDILQHDIFSGPATFWISNPNNIVRYNHAAGSKGSGLWLAPHSVLGTSRPELLALDPNAWVGNTAHSNKHGVAFGGQPKSGDPGQAPVTGTGLQTRETVILNDHTTYKNHTGSYIRNDWAKTYMNNWKIADNYRGTLNTWESCFESCLYVGGSDNYEERFNDCENSVAQKIYGHTLYDGPYFINDSHFAQFDKPNMSAISNRGASRRTFVSKLKNVSTDIQPAQLDFLNNPFDDPHHIGAGIYDDENGTLTGYANAAIVSDHPFMTNENCVQVKDGFNGYACQNRYGHIAIQTHYTNANNNTKRQPIIISRSDGPSVYMRPVYNMNFYQFNPIVDDQYNYKVQFSEHIPGQFTFEASSFKTGESTIIEIPNIPLTALKIKSTLYNSVTTLLAKNSYTALKNSSKTAYYYDENSLFIKIVMPVNPNFNGGLLEYPHSVQVCLTGTCSNFDTKEITLSDNDSDWSTSFSNNNCLDYNYHFSQQNFTFYSHLKVKLNSVAQSNEEIEALLFDESEGLVSLGSLPLNNTNKTFYFTLPAKLSNAKDEIYQIALRTCGGFSKTNIQSVELLNGNELNDTNKPPSISKLSTYISNYSNISIFSDNLVDDWKAATSIKISNLPPGLTYNEETREIKGSLSTPGNYPFDIKAFNQVGGINTQTINLQANYIQNASFEYPQQEKGDGYQIDYYTLYDNNPDNYPQNANWVFDGESGISANNTTFTKQTNDATDGDQVAIIKGYGEICTDIIIPANTNYLYFDAAQRDCNDQVIQVKMNNTILQEFEPEDNGVYTTYKVDVSNYSVILSTHTLCFKGLRSWHTGFIDNVRFNACEATACNDGDECTINDVLDSNCNCSGIYADSDNDGVCNENDICPQGDDNLDTNNNGVPDACDNCIAIANISCTDNDGCTIDDRYDNNCNCIGTFADSDNDGVCDINDVCPQGDDNIDTNNNGIPDACDNCIAIANSGCDDNDVCTSNDKYDNNCNCAGTYSDSDNDGVCDANDVCPQGDDNIDTNNNGVPDACDNCIAIANTNCNDNDVCTINDKYDNNCNCNGTYTDSDNDGVCDTEDVCPQGDDNIDTNNNGIPDACDNCIAIANTTCDDNDVCTTNDLFDDNCNCIGEFEDEDNDGVCDANDICDLGDDNIDTNNNGIPDACEGACDNTLSSTFLNGGFENPDLDNKFSSYIFRPTNADWVFGLNSGISGNKSAFTYNNNVAPEGDQVAFVKHNGFLCQTLYIPTESTYGISFIAALRVIDSSSEQIINISVDGEIVESMTINSTEYLYFQTSPVSLSEGCHEICLTAINADGENRTVFIDDIALEGNDCYQVFDSEDFELDFGIWNDGGSDAARYNYQPYAFSGTHFIQLRDNNETSTITTNSLNFTNVSSVKIDFNYYTFSMDNYTEDFWLQVSTDGGATFTTVEEWNLSDEFVNDERYNESVEIQQAFSSQTQFRFRCDASSNFDSVFIDDIIISTCFLNAKIAGQDAGDASTTRSQNFNLTFAPNPARSVANVNFKLETASNVHLELFGTSGKLVKQLLNSSLKDAGTHNMEIDVNDLPNGTYILLFKTKYKSAQQKIVVAR